MAFQQRDMSGVLFKNDKGDNASRPDYRGDITINEVVYELAAWIKEGAKGKFMSLSAKPKEARPAETPRPNGMDVARTAYARETGRTQPVDLDDSIPF